MEFQHTSSNDDLLTDIESLDRVIKNGEAKSERTALQDQTFRNFLVYTKQDTGAMVSLYRLARSESEELLKLIDEELGT